jgi:methylthioribose-1-phosphate isomerase
MNVEGQHYRTIWRDGSGIVRAIDQRRLPFEFEICSFDSVEQIATASAYMTVRGAGIIGAAAGYGMYLAALTQTNGSPQARAEALSSARTMLNATRPTAVNLSWATRRVIDSLDVSLPSEGFTRSAAEIADAIADEDVEHCRLIGEHGLEMFSELHASVDRTLNVLTHCNAGWLAFVDHGTATAPIYAAHDAGIPIHVWVDETRPRNQGARLTAWELAQHGVDHTVIVDNAGGHLMQHGMVDAVLVGSDRTTGNGDVANKIGTYLKALAAFDNDLPFYAALPSSTIDWSNNDGVAQIPIEQRDAEEVTHITGWTKGSEATVRLTPSESSALNYGFDVTPSRLVTAIITERGVCEPADLAGLFANRLEEHK